MDKNHKFFCIEPYVGLSIIEPGKVFCCCLHEGGEVTTPDDIWNDPYLKNIRAKFDRDEIPDECASCVEQENLDRTSRRLDSNANWLEYHANLEDFKEISAPYKLDFWTGNICNLACITCGAHDSSLWGTLQKRKNLNTFHRRGNPANHPYKKENPPNIDYTNLEWIHFNGGEPLLTDTHFKLLENIPKERRKNVKIEYNTNGTVRVDIHDEKYKIFKDFKSVTLCFSIDGIEETFEYTRWPAKWNIVKDNIDAWVTETINQDWEHNEWFIAFSFNIVKSAYNYDKIDETINYINNNWLTPIRIANPEKFNVDMMFLCNDHRHLDFTDKNFEEFRKTTDFISEKKTANQLRKR